MSAHKRMFEDIREYEQYLEEKRNKETIKQINKCQSQHKTQPKTLNSAPQVTTLPDATK